MYGDATKLPFRNESVDFVYTAAVLEHVRNPLIVGSEISRSQEGWNRSCQLSVHAAYSL